MQFAITSIEHLQIESRSPLSEMYKLSPFVWRDPQSSAGYQLLIRAVPHSENSAEKIARIYHGRSDDGIRFRMGDAPVIAPGPEPEDTDGCEDPTLTVCDGTYYVYYSGWNEREKQGQLLLATGSEIERLQKRGVSLASTAHRLNPKEATLVQAADDSWRLFFEYSENDASKVGIASSASPAGPWKVLDPLFEARPDSWDNWHLSTGPICSGEASTPVMFYNGATREAHWRIGWIAFDPKYTRVVGRSVDPIIAPPAEHDPGDTDIAFSASAVEEGDSIRLYYSIADKDMCCAFIRRL